MSLYVPLYSTQHILRCIIKFSVHSLSHPLSLFYVCEEYQRDKAQMNGNEEKNCEVEWKEKRKQRRRRHHHRQPMAKIVIHKHTYLTEEKNGTKSLCFMAGLCIEMAIILASNMYISYI